jgi:hypothetical protein
MTDSQFRRRTTDAISLDVFQDSVELVEVVVADDELAGALARMLYAYLRT